MRHKTYLLCVLELLGRVDAYESAVVIATCARNSMMCKYKDRYKCACNAGFALNPIMCYSCMYHRIEKNSASNNWPSQQYTTNKCSKPIRTCGAVGVVGGGAALLVLAVAAVHGLVHCVVRKKTKQSNA